MKVFFGKIIAFLYSSAEAITEAANTGLSVLISGNSRNKLTLFNYLLSSSLAVFTGIVTWVTTYFFEGAEIKRNLSNRFSDDSDEEKEAINHYPSPNLTIRYSAFYLVCKYGYIISTVMVRFLEICLLFSATKTWAQDLEEGNTNPLSFISNSEVTFLFVNYLLFSLPFVLTNEIAENSQQIRQSFNIDRYEVPDKKLIKQFKNYVQPLAKNTFFQKYVRITGSAVTTLAHMTSVIIIVPISWLLEISRQPTVISWGIGATTALMLLITATSILVQTYLFDGKYSEKNLKALAGINNSHDQQSPWLSPTVAKIFRKFLYLESPLRGIDSALTLLLTVKELTTQDLFAYLSASLAFTITTMGHHYSEGKFSLVALEKITYTPRLFSHQKPSYRSFENLPVLLAITANQPTINS